ncbi:hypothetical protein A2Y99_04580 [Candidatus Gottesmanbacteria bacterium RBG_13_37_7]|uniref:Glutamyl-tRNA amidotransferase n=1 Tax=Candidatus Gottesmanbacteria bacterium RBG_13_37_7 TaxID=1798369 RepID=A0A1F5YGX4_9BACT|nr:MAG: hypothetical protein A2Y99_04580 [Candidatus Gottesmanbacteria bacterium RBG_13_37_7]
MIKDDIQKAIFQALKEKKETDLKALRFILSEIKYAEIDTRKELTDDEVVLLLHKEINKRKEAVTYFIKGKRNDLVEEEEKQIEVIKKYMPQELTNRELEKIIDKILSSTAEKNFGRIIGLVMAKVKGRTDGRTVSDIVQKKISPK